MAVSMGWMKVTSWLFSCDFHFIGGKHGIWFTFMASGVIMKTY